MKLSVIILNWGNATATSNCVGKIRAWQNVQAQIIVVDNGSTINEIAVLEKLTPPVQLLLSKRNLGFAGGNNLALKFLESAKDDAPVLLLNNDADITEDQITKLLNFLNAHPKAAIVGPILVEQTSSGKVISAGGQNIGHHPNAHRNLDKLPTTEQTQACPVAYVPGTIALIRAKALRQVGFLDEQYFFAGEVADWCKRACLLGYVALIDSQAIGYHDTHKPSNIRSTLYLYYSLRNRFLYVRKFENRRWLLFWLYYALRVAAGNLRRGQINVTRAALLAAWHGLWGRFGNQNRHFGLS